MALAIVAFMLLGIVTMNFRVMNFQNEDILNSNEYSQKAVAIGRSLFEEMSQKPFDAAIAAGKRITKTSDLTACGPGSGEVYPNFNDFDDFHRSVFVSPATGTTPTSTTPKCLWDTWGYTVAVTVQYVSESNPEQPSNTYTFAKRATLRISNEFSADTVFMSYVTTY